MTPDHNHHFKLPDDLSAEAAAQLIECLYELARVIENRYFAQIHQHHQQATDDDDEQFPLWDNDPPF